MSHMTASRARDGRRVEPVEATYRTLHARTVELLREAITSGRLAPGERLRTQALAEELGVSRLPVREALHTLRAEGLVEFESHRGAVVASLSAEEIQEVYLLRTLLEPAAACLAAARRPDGVVADLTRLVERLEAAEAEPSRWIDLDREFHMTLYRASGQRLLCESIARLRASVERYVRLYILAPRNIPHSRAKHREILLACRAGNAVLAERATREHLAEVEEIFLDELRARASEPRARGGG